MNHDPKSFLSVVDNGDVEIHMDIAIHLTAAVLRAAMNDQGGDLALERAISAEVKGLAFDIKHEVFRHHANLYELMDPS